MAVITPPQDYAGRVRTCQSALLQNYEAAYKVSGAAQRKLAEALLSRIGTVDWEGEGYSSPDHQRDLSIKFHWGHNHRFADDLLVEGRMKHRHLSLMAEFTSGFGLSPGHFRDKAVLDVGCWTGGTTLVLKLLGAGRVLALEEVRKYAEAAETLVRDVYGFSDVSCAPVSLYRLTEGTFDTIYFPGVIYHLSDPVLALRRLFNRLRDGGDILVESAGIAHDKSMCEFRGNRRYHSSSTGELNRGGWNWFFPSPACLSLWMEEAGFDDTQVYFSPVTKRVFGYGRRTQFRDITRAGLSVPDVE